MTFRPSEAAEIAATKPAAPPPKTAVSHTEEVALNNTTTPILTYTYIHAAYGFFDR